MSKQAAPKNFLLSKTFWVNLVAMASLISPQVRDWLAANPVQFLAVLGAVNIVLRFVTSGAVTFSQDGDSQDGGASGGSGGILPLALFFLAAACLLPSCSTEYPLTGSFTYRDPGSGAKGGLTFTPGETPSGFIRVPIYDPETGEQVGQAELRGPLAGAVEPSGK